MFDFLFKKEKKKEGVFVLFDIGGTKMRVATSLGGMPTNVRVLPTPKEFKAGMEALIKAIKEEVGDRRILRAAGCIAGRVDGEGKIYDARNLPQWEGADIKVYLHEAFAMEVPVLNDCELEGLGEAYVGAGVGAETMAYITVSTGVGGARIFRGSVDVQADTFSVGRIHVGDSDLEGTVSGTAVKKRFGVDAKDLESAQKREELAVALSVGLVEVVREWKPDVIVIGGSMITGNNAIALESVDRHVAENLSGKKPTIKKAVLGDTAGLSGALVYLQQQ